MWPKITKFRWPLLRSGCCWDGTVARVSKQHPVFSNATGFLRLPVTHPFQIVNFYSHVCCLQLLPGTNFHYASSVIFIFFARKTFLFNYIVNISYIKCSLQGRWKTLPRKMLSRSHLSAVCQYRHKDKKIAFADTAKLTFGIQAGDESHSSYQ